MSNLWIRSQDKKRLTIVNSLGYGEYRNPLNEYMFYIFCQNGCVLGEYKTKERCIEIIDEIQKLLLSANPENAFVVLKNIDITYEELTNYIERARKDNFFAYFGSENDNVEFVQPNVLVYEMPEE